MLWVQDWVVLSGEDETGRENVMLTAEAIRVFCLQWACPKCGHTNSRADDRNYRPGHNADICDKCCELVTIGAVVYENGCKVQTTGTRT